MQKFIFANIGKCLHGSLLAKLLMHIHAHAKHAKTCKYITQKILQVQSNENFVHMIHMLNANILIYVICLISQNP